MAERGTGGKILSLATKRARRVQEKMLQKLGKSDQTKDDVFQDFVSNFHLQSTASTKLSKELVKFMSAIRTLSQCTNSLGETLLELYEPSWAGHTEYKSIIQTRALLWDDQLMTMQSKIVEPMNNYMQKFPEVKNRIQKRERKVVDYDLRRRELETLRTKHKVTDQKLQQAEDTYSQAKLRFDEITDDLYEELPSFFDSRIQFYASVFQNLASSEAHFHSEITKVDQAFADLMDGLAAEAATSIHSTKRERTLDSIPKLLSRPGEDGDSDEVETRTTAPEPSANHTSFHEPPVSGGSSPSHSDTSNSKADKPVVSPGNGTGSLRRLPPSKPTRSSSAMEQNAGEPVQKPEATLSPPQDSDVVPSSPTPQSQQEQSLSDTPQQGSKSPHPPTPHELSSADLEELEGVIELTEDATPTSPHPGPSPKLEAVNLEQREEEPKPETETPGLEVPNPEPETPNTESEAQNPEPKIQNPEPESQNPEPESQNPELETQNTEPETQNPEPETQNPEAEVQNPEAEVQNPEPEVQTPELEVQNPKSEAQNPKSEVQNPEPEASNPQPEVEKPTAKDPEDTLYKVVATHPYEGEDDDELTFAKGDVIAVVPYVDPDDEEEGWATGVILVTGAKGIFPENFTKKLE